MQHKPGSITVGLLAAIGLSLVHTCLIAGSPAFTDANWTSVGADGMVHAAAVDDAGNLYIGGSFTNLGGIVANGIAKWDGNSWSALGSGISGAPPWGDDPAVFALAVSGSNVYAAGNFTVAGGVGVSYIAKWDGSSWSDLGGGVNSEVDALAVSGSDLYAGGFFTTAGGIPAKHIAKWNGSNWSEVGYGVANGIYTLVAALAVSGSNLYVGGDFTKAGDIAANDIAKWDGNDWSALGAGVYRVVSALAVSGSNVYVGGSFSTFYFNNVAKWDGSSWSPLGSGVNNEVAALAVLGNDLYAGGLFTIAGGKVSEYIARAIINTPLLAIEPDGGGGYFIRFSGVPGCSYRLQRAQTLNGQWTTSAPQVAPASGLVEFHDLFPPPDRSFYRTLQE
jgi:hypothetical protein